MRLVTFKISAREGKYACEIKESGEPGFTPEGMNIVRLGLNIEESFSGRYTNNASTEGCNILRK